MQTGQFAVAVPLGRHKLRGTGRIQRAARKLPEEKLLLKITVSNSGIQIKIYYIYESRGPVCPCGLHHHAL